MNKPELYYTPPKQELFDDLKKNAIELWKEIDTDNDKYGYASEKINRIKDLENVGDNFMFIVTMFDVNNQFKLAQKLLKETKEAICDRFIDGGGFDYIF